MPHHQFQDFECAPRLRFKLNWSSDSLKGIVERPKPLTNRDNFETKASHKTTVALVAMVMVVVLEIITIIVKIDLVCPDNPRPMSVRITTA